MSTDVLRLADIDPAALRALFGAHGLSIEWLAAQTDIPGSYWGESEAGLEIEARRRLEETRNGLVRQLLDAAAELARLDNRKRSLRDLHRDRHGPRCASAATSSAWRPCSRCWSA